MTGLLVRGRVRHCPRSVLEVPAGAWAHFFLPPALQHQPDTVHLEVRMADRLDIDRLLRAAMDATEQHPMARAHLTPWHAGTVHPSWCVDDHVTAIPMTVWDCHTAAETARLRAELLDLVPSLRRAPLFSIGVARESSGDLLILSLHHALYDAVAAIRLLRSILRVYGHRPDPVPDLDPIMAYVEQSRLPKRAFPQHIDKATSHLRRRRNVTAPAGIAVSGGVATSRTGALTFVLDRSETRAILDARGPDSTMTDILAAAFVVAIRGWNRLHTARLGPVTIAIPANARPSQWHDEVLGVFIGATLVSVSDDAPDDLDALLPVVTAQTRQAKRTQIHTAAPDFLRPLEWLPAALKTTWRRRLAVRQPATSVLSNVGVLADLADLGVTEAWISPPTGASNNGLVMGVASVRESVGVCLRYRRSHFDEQAVSELAERFRDVLLDG